MGKVVGSTNKESGTNSYAKNNQSAIKALATAGKAGSFAGSVISVGVKTIGKAYKNLAENYNKKKIKKQKQKEMEAVDV